VIPEYELASPPPHFSKLRALVKNVLAQAGKLKISEDDPDLKRSARRKEKSRGFKNSSCADKGEKRQEDLRNLTSCSLTL
jgi:hypothetical protein